MRPLAVGGSLPNASPHRRLSFRAWLRLIVLIVVVGGIGWLALVTGFWQPPVLSSLVYDEPAPLRDVSALPPSDNIALQISLNGEASVTLHEQELTALARSQKNFPLLDPVIVLTQEDLQLFGSMPFRPQMKVLAHAVPTARDGRLDIEITDAQIGELQIPAVLLGVTSSVLEAVVLAPLPTLDEVRNIQLTDRILRFDVTL